MKRVVFCLLLCLASAPAVGADRETVTVTVDCGAYRGLWSIEGVVRSVSCAASSGRRTEVALEPGRTYAFQPAQVGRAFDLRVDAEGRVAVDPPEAAQVEGRTITLATVPLRVDAGPYVGTWKIRLVGSRPPGPRVPWFEHRRQSIAVVPGVVYDLHVARPIVARPIRVRVARDGSLAIVPPAEGRSAGFVFDDAGMPYLGLRTVCVHVQAPATFAWAVNSANWKAQGSSTRVLVAGCTYGLERRGDEGYEPWATLAVPDDPLPGWSRILSQTLPDGSVVRAFTSR